jgi:hypothetical protein
VSTAQRAAQEGIFLDPWRRRAKKGACISSWPPCSWSRARPRPARRASVAQIMAETIAGFRRTIAGLAPLAAV